MLSLSTQPQDNLNTSSLVLSRTDLATMSEPIPPASSDILELLRQNINATLHIMDPVRREGFRHEELHIALCVFKTTVDAAWECAARRLVDARSNHERVMRGDIAVGGEVSVGRGAEAERIREERERIAAETERLKADTEKIKAEAERALAEKERLIVEVQRVNGEIEYKKLCHT